MSIKVSLFYWDNGPSVSHTEKLVLLALAFWADDEGVCYPSIPSIAKRCALSDRGVQKVIDRLVDAGQLVIEGNMGTRKGGGSATNRYHLIAYQASIGAVRVNVVTDKGERIGSPTEAAEGERCAVRVNAVQVKGERIGSPDPSLERSLDPSEEERARVRELELPSSSSSTPPPAIVATSKPEPKPAAMPFPAPSENYAKVRAVYEQNFGLLSSILPERIKEALRKYPIEWIMLAMERAVMAEKRRWDYVEGILRNWESEGFNNARPRKANATAGNGNAIGHRTDSPKPWADYQPTEFDEELSAMLNG